MNTATIIQHVGFEDLGAFGPALADRGIEVRVLLAGRDEITAASLGNPDLLVVLGGPISANDERVFPFIAEEMRFLGQWLTADKPCLGVCLGAQLMAKALGGTVRPMASKEIGWYRVDLTPEGRDSPLAELGDTSVVLHWHGEEVTLPRNCRRLASSEMCQNQAFSCGEHGLAIQFHPEVTTQGLEPWYIGHIVELSSAGVDVLELRRDAREYGPTLQVGSRRLVDRWLTECGL